MKSRNLLSACVCLVLAGASALSQGTVIINQPELHGGETPKIELSAAEQKLMDTGILPGVRKHLGTDACDEFIDIAGKLQGAFTRSEAKQTLIFYQFCQTGNGLGISGVAI